jgi:hypothetical protein
MHLLGMWCACSVQRAVCCNHHQHRGRTRHQHGVDGAGVKEAFHHLQPYSGYKIMNNWRQSCGLQLAPALKLRSLHEALEACNGYRGCTFVLHQAASGLTQLCNTYYDDYEVQSVLARGWQTAFREGCQHFKVSEELLLTVLQLFGR